MQKHFCHCLKKKVAKTKDIEKSFIYAIINFDCNDVESNLVRNYFLLSFFSFANMLWTPLTKALVLIQVVWAIRVTQTATMLSNLQQTMLTWIAIFWILTKLSSTSSKMRSSWRGKQVESRSNKLLSASNRNRLSRSLKSLSLLNFDKIVFS